MPSNPREGESPLRGEHRGRFSVLPQKRIITNKTHSPGGQKPSRGGWDFAGTTNQTTCDAVAREGRAASAFPRGAAATRLETLPVVADDHIGHSPKGDSLSF